MSYLQWFRLLVAGVVFSLGSMVGVYAEQRGYGFSGATKLEPRIREVTCEGGSLEFTDAGLRVVVDSTDQSGAACGVAFQNPLGGDFICSVQYSLENVKPPPAGIGSGVKLFATTVGPKEMALTFAHLLGPDGKAFYLVMLRPNDGKNNRFQKYDAGDAKSGTLRISRVGNDLTYSVSAGDVGAASEFKELFKTFIEPQALAGVRWVNSVSGAAAATVVLHDAKFVADRFDRNYVKRAGRGSASVFWGVFAVGLLASVAGAVFLLRRKQAVVSEPVEGDADE